MAYYKIPLSDEPDQELYVTVEIAGENRPLMLRIRYNTESEGYMMDINDGVSGADILAGLALVTGTEGSEDLLLQYAHLGLGSAILRPLTDAARTRSPELDTLWQDYELIWGDAT